MAGYIVPDDERCTEITEGSFSSTICMNRRRSSDDYPTLCGVHANAQRKRARYSAMHTRLYEWRQKRQPLESERGRLVLSILKVGVLWAITQNPERQAERASLVEVLQRYAEVERQIRALDEQYRDLPPEHTYPYTNAQPIQFSTPAR